MTHVGAINNEIRGMCEDIGREIATLAGLSRRAAACSCDASYTATHRREWDLSRSLIDTAITALDNASRALPAYLTKGDSDAA